MRQAAFAIAILALCTAPAGAAELACEGVFGIDTSEARFIATFGAENVVTAEVPGPEGMTMIATIVYPGDPEREFQAVWWDEEGLKDLSYVSVPPGDTAPGGVRIGMSIADVEELNGGPFTIYGFDWDYGGAANFEGGALAELPQDCRLMVSFQPSLAYPEGVDIDPIIGDKEVPSDLPLMRRVEPKVTALMFGYPHPDFR